MIWSEHGELGGLTWPPGVWLGQITGRVEKITRGLNPLTPPAIQTLGLYPKNFLIFCVITLLSGTSGTLCFKVNVPATKASKPVLVWRGQDKIDIFSKMVHFSVNSELETFGGLAKISTVCQCLVQNIVYVVQMHYRMKAQYAYGVTGICRTGKRRTGKWWSRTRANVYTSSDGKL